MKAREALRVLAEVSESQWGMVTSAQANARGVSHMNLTRLTESGDIVRLSHGVYKDAGAPGGEHDELRSAWLAAEPARLAGDRVQEKPGTVVVSGESAADLLRIGNLRAMRSEFTTPSRRQTQRRDVHYRTRILTSDDVTVREGLPVTTPERTIADLVEQRAQLDHVGDALRDAARTSRLDTDRLSELLGPLAERNGYSKGDGGSLLDDLLETAHIDLHSVSQRIAKMPDLGALVTHDYLATIDPSALLNSPAFRSVFEAQAQQNAELAEALSRVVMPAVPAFDKLAESLAAATAMFDTPALRSVLQGQQAQIDALSATLSKLAVPDAEGRDVVRKAAENLTAVIARRGADIDARRLSETISAMNWAALAQRVKRSEVADVDGEEL